MCTILVCPLDCIVVENNVSKIIILIILDNLNILLKDGLKNNLHTQIFLPIHYFIIHKTLY